MTRRLDFGCAFEKHEGWTGSDLNDYGQEHVGDILDGLPWPDHHFDMITAHHSLQMITFTDLPARSWSCAGYSRWGEERCGSRCRMRSWAVHRFLADWDQFPISEEIERTKPGRFLRYLLWHGDARSAFTFESLTDTLNRNGFQNVRRCEFRQTHSSYPEIVDLDGRKSESLIIECTR
jgi:hypothetical protein